MVLFCCCLDQDFLLQPKKRAYKPVNYAIGLFELPWCLLALVLFFGTLRQAMVIRVIHAAIVLLFLTGSLGGFTKIVAFTKVSGWIAVLLSLLSFIPPLPCCTLLVSHPLHYLLASQNNQK
jgi:succinate-acetate transporter protein